MLHTQTQSILAIALVALLSAVPGTHRLFAAETVILDADSVVQYVLSCRKENGAFGPMDQDYTDAAWNFPAVKTLALLDEEIDRPELVIDNGLGYPAGHVGYGHWQFFHQHSLRKQLGRPIQAKHRRVRLTHQGYEIRYYGSPFGTEGDTFFKAPGGNQAGPRDIDATELGYYNLSSLYYLLQGLAASGRTPANPRELAQYITARQSPGGGFVDVRTREGKPTDAEAHIAHTFHALACLNTLGEGIPATARCHKFVVSCQLPIGGFRFHPNDETPSNRPDVYYTWAAIGALQLMGRRPADEQACIDWINKLHNHDGGFGDRLGWRSRLYSTYYATHVLSMLAREAREAVSKKVRHVPSSTTIPKGLGIYQGLNKMPVCQENDLAGLQERGFDLIGIKSDEFALAERLQKAALGMRVPMDVFLCPEAYPHRTRRFGGALLHHIGNVTLDPSWDQGRKRIWSEADAAGQRVLTWSEYQRRVIREMRQAGSLYYPEQDFEMEYAYSAYDDGLYGAGGYNAVLAGFNWAPRDFVRVFPWRERYVDKLTPIADADAHGNLAKWSPQLDHARHLFIAKGTTYADFQEAAVNRRVVCVIYGAPDTPSAVTYYGPRAAVRYVKQRINQWKWWEPRD